jgi:outer membrane protein assembly factor BamB
VSVETAFPGEDAMRKNWPSFRGFRGLGVAGEGDPPVEWDGTAGKNVRWKTKVPLKGFNSPIVWENRVFLSGASSETREVYCLDLENGRILWRTATRGAGGVSIPEVTEDTGLAAPTLATNGLRVAALFATGELMVLDFQGKRLWEKKLETPRNHYGHSSSLLAWRDLLWVQYDHMDGARVIAFRLSDGGLAWERSRPVDISWASPILAPVSRGDQLILAAPPGLAAYDPGSGKELWTSGEIVSGELGPSPAFDRGRVYLANQYSMLTCLDVQTREKLWEYDDHLPDASSPVAAAGLFIMPSSYGTVSCFDGAGGELLWQESFDTGFYASPVVAGENVYLVDKNGTTRIFRLDRVFREVASPGLGEGSVSTPAFTGDVAVIRGMEHCFCIEKEEP